MRKSLQRETADHGIFSQRLQSLVARRPRLDVPFLEAFNVTYGPAGLLGRFFITCDTRLRDRGLTLRFISSEELARIQALNADNWGFFNPMYDARCSDVAPGSMCVGAFDSKGFAQAVICGKPFDATTQTFDEIIDAQGFFGVRPEDNFNNMRTVVTDPVVAELRGLIAYCASVWVHPDRRGERIAATVTRLMNAVMLTLWNPDVVLGAIPPKQVGSGLHTRYSYRRLGGGFTVYRGSEFWFDEVLVWETPEETTLDLAHYLDVLWPQIDAAVAARKNNHAA